MLKREVPRKVIFTLNKLKRKAKTPHMEFLSLFRPCLNKLEIFLALDHNGSDTNLKFKLYVLKNTS